MLQYLFDHATAGIWNYVWHWGTAGFVIVACIAAYIGMDYLAALPGVRLIAAPMQKYKIDLLWVAVAAAVYLVGLGQGDRDASARCKAQQVVVEKRVTSVVKAAKQKATQARRAKKVMEDPFNDPNN